ncbi:MAG: permease [Anaerolineales bacterium]|jgi:uncharacterized membrane protein YraQ (UPF0718 family)
MRDRTPLFLLLVAVLLAGLTWHLKGPETVLEGFATGMDILLSVVPLLVAAFLVAGLVQVLATRELITRWIGASSGWKGIALACLGGGLMPGGPYVYYPITAVLLQTGAGLGPLVAFVTAKNLWAFSRLPLELALLGSQLTLFRFLVTFALPPLLGYLAEKLFGHRLEAIRQGAGSS